MLLYLSALNAEKYLFKNTGFSTKPVNNSSATSQWSALTSVPYKTEMLRCWEKLAKSLVFPTQKNLVN